MTDRVDPYAPSRRLEEVKALLHSTGGMTIYEISERLRVSVRTAIRYLRALERAGEPLWEDLDGRRKIWRLRVSSRTETITLTRSQMLALFLSRQACDFLIGTGFKEDLDEVFARLETTLKRKDFVTARNLDRKIYDRNEAPHVYAGRAGDVNDIMTALLYEHRLRVRHASVGQGRPWFLVEPYTLLLYKKGLYLVGLSHHHGEIRTLALDGFRAVEWLKGQRFEYPESYHPSQRIQGAFGLFGGPPEQVRVFFREGVARLVRRRTWHPTQKIKKVPGGVELSMEVASTVDVASWVVGFGDQAVVLAPASLRAQVGAQLRRAAAAYDEAPV